MRFGRHRAPGCGGGDEDDDDADDGCDLVDYDGHWRGPGDVSGDDAGYARVLTDKEEN